MILIFWRTGPRPRPVALPPLLTIAGMWVGFFVACWAMLAGEPIQGVTGDVVWLVLGLWLLACGLATAWAAAVTLRDAE